MPLTRAGKVALIDFKKQYGNIKGKGVFYAYMKSHPKQTVTWHLTRHKRFR